VSEPSPATAYPAPPEARAARRRARTRRRWIRRALVIAAAAGLVVAVVFALLPKPVAVDLGAVRAGPMEVTVREDGRTRVENRYQVSAPLSGNLPRVDLREGDPVAEGQVLARVAPAVPALLDERTRAEAQARLSAAQAGQRQAEAQVSRVRAELEHARGETARLRPLAERGVASRKEADDAEYLARVAAEELTAAEFAAKVAAQQVASAQAALGLLQGRGRAEPALALPSPVSGRVLRVLRVDEGFIAAGTPIVEVGDLDSLEVVADILTRDAVHVRPGARAIIVGWGGDQALAGRVHRVEPSAFTRVSALGVEEQRVNVVIDFDRAEPVPPALGDGFRVDVRVVVWEADDVLTVPASAVFRRGDGWAVFAVAGDRARLTPVEVGRRDEAQVQILGGLAAGDRVVLHPSDRVTDGVHLEARGG
jgi:HlyD family secretion protein